MSGGSVIATSCCGMSDSSLKRDIRPIENALSKVSQLRGVTFGWRTKDFPNQNLDTRIHLGLVAQEVEHVIPEAVVTDARGYKGVEYGNLVALLIEAVKEQQATIQNLTERLEQLSHLIDDKLSFDRPIENNTWR